MAQGSGLTTRCEQKARTEEEIPSLDAFPPAGANSSGKTDEVAFADWLERYSVGQIGPADQAPDPPASILAILEGLGKPHQPSPSTATPPSPSSLPPADVSSTSRPNKPRREPISLAITLSPGSSRPSSSSSSVASTPSTSAPSLLNPAVTEKTASKLLEHYRNHGTFPAPVGPYEEERLRLAHKYGLDQPVRRNAIDRICSIAKAHFKTKMAVVSLTLDNHQVLGAERGFATDGEPTLEDPLRRLEIDPAFCTHAMAASYKDPKEVFVVADANKDWRFARNPYSTGSGGGISFYSAANINLPVGDTASRRGLPSTLASGALCLMDGTRTLRDPSEFTTEDRAVLSDLAEMIAREFQLGFEERRRKEEQKQSDFLGEFLRGALVQPAQPGSLFTVNSDPSSSTTSRGTSPLNSLDQEEGQQTSTSFEDRPFDFPSQSPHPQLSRQKALSNLAPFSTSTPPSPSRRDDSSETSSDLAPSLFTTAATNLISLTGSQSCAILDLHGFNSKQFQPQAQVFALSPTQTNSFAPPVPTPSDYDSGPLSRRSSNATVQSPRVPRNRTESFGLGPENTKTLRGKIGLMASEGNVDWRGIVKRSSKIEKRRRSQAETGELDADAAEDPLVLAIDETIRMYYSMTQEEIVAEGLEGAFSAYSILPSQTSDTHCVPVFDVDGSPALMIVLSSAEKWFRFERSDRRFIESVGAVLVGSLLRERARESDRAKLSFISQVSHEVRTPLYGVSSQLSLIREFSSPPELRKVAPLLDAAELCVDSLSSVLEDTLDFSKLSNSTAAEEASISRRRLARIDLVTLIEGVLTSTWIKKKRADLVTVDLGGVLEVEAKESEEERRGKLDLILEIEDKQDGWEVSTDVGGLRRVLLNVVGNALKFTKTGHVKITLRYLGRTSSIKHDPGTPQPRRRPSLDQSSYRGHVAIVVEDTGIGMSSDFLREGQLFTPFKQADSFSVGVGLGLSICDSIIKRLGPGRLDVTSELGVGTEVSITLPIEFIGSQQSTASSFPFDIHTGTSTRRMVSTELDNLFFHASDILPTPEAQARETATATNASPPVSSLHHSPTISKPPPVDFPSAVSALQSTLSAVLEIEAKPNSGADELVIEAAKLAISATQQVESSVIPMSSPGAIVVEEKEIRNSFPATIATESVTTQVQKQRTTCIAPDLHVLFADDNPVARNVLIKLFSGKRIKFSAAEDGQQAVDLFSAAEGHISLILMDVQMPIMDGIGATHAIRQLEVERGWERCRIIALTGLSNEKDMAEASEGGVDKWVIKGGKSLRIIMEEVAEVQQEIEARRSLRLDS
ncbi:hybrid sensor histidine kinase/response regulator [Sporobolomyces salmoneus]|uniref:hybrid sensor histidine kinase/response regulator n=1 Tax=Sporobolomyces salmoneus TaxID=183962 RepID=UPI003179D443